LDIFHPTQRKPILINKPELVLFQGSLLDKNNHEFWIWRIRLNFLEKDFEDILCKYPELIEDGLTLIDRQKTVHNRRMDILFKDKFERNLLVELKRGPIKDNHVGQILSYEGLLLSADDPTIRVMLIGNRVPPNIQKSLDHHGIAWKEISYSALKEFVESKDDTDFIKLFEDVSAFNNTIKTNSINQRVKPKGLSGEKIDFTKGDERIEVLKEKLIKLVEEIKASINQNVEFEQQDKIKEHMSLTGCGDRLFILPSSKHVYEVSLFGLSIEKNLYGFMKKLFGRDCDGYRNKKNKRQPRWWTDDFDLVRKAAIIYAKSGIQ
jgi:hypothetical protein